MTIQEITDFLEEIAPPSLQEDYDNSGLLVGHSTAEIDKLLLSLDVTEEVVEEAAAKGCGLIISHHPTLFGSLKRLTGKTHVERTVMAALKNDIATIRHSYQSRQCLYRGKSAPLAKSWGWPICRYWPPKKTG
ncbi:MAG: Nif3-like dinuclear metal center hexameric protein [Owenweeksia sp.]|nr:Nif3-like dinuclear metal center hexameric protein [Owenweeksia sp.]